jgi:hypothetical protein
MITPYVPLVLRENLKKVGNPRHKKSVGNEFVSARLGRVGQKCRLLAVGPTCRRHVGDFPSQAEHLAGYSYLFGDNRQSGRWLSFNGEIQRNAHHNAHTNFHGPHFPAFVYSEEPNNLHPHHYEVYSVRGNSPHMPKMTVTSIYSSFNLTRLQGKSVHERSHHQGQPSARALHMQILNSSLIKWQCPSLPSICRGALEHCVGASHWLEYWCWICLKNGLYMGEDVGTFEGRSRSSTKGTGFHIVHLHGCSFFVRLVLVQHSFAILCPDLLLI